MGGGEIRGNSSRTRRRRRTQSTQQADRSGDRRRRCHGRGRTLGGEGGDGKVRCIVATGSRPWLRSIARAEEACKLVTAAAGGSLASRRGADRPEVLQVVASEGLQDAPQRRHASSTSPERLCQKSSWAVDHKQSSMDDVVLRREPHILVHTDDWRKNYGRSTGAA